MNLRVLAMVLVFIFLVVVVAVAVSSIRKILILALNYYSAR